MFRQYVKRHYIEWKLIWLNIIITESLDRVYSEWKYKYLGQIKIYPIIIRLYSALIKSR